MKLLLFVTVVCLSSVLGLDEEASNDEIIDDKAAGCEINLNGGLSEPQPLLIQPGTDQFLEPEDTDGILRLKKGEKVELSCVGNRFNISNMETIATCVSGSKFKLKTTKQYDFSEFFCSQYPKHTARKTGKKCYNGNTLAEIGYKLDDGRFLWLMTVCHDEDLAHSLYSYYKLNPQNVGFQSAFPRPSFVKGGFYTGFDINAAYNRNSQREVFGKILGSSKLGEELIHPTDDYFLARGHLAAKAEYVYGTQQRATFYYINACPQWQNFNNGFWKRIENEVTVFVGERGINVEVYTGTHGIVSAADNKGVQRELYLDIDENGNYRLPLPKLYYKLVIEPSTKYGVVIIGVNNPHLSLAEIRKDYIVCTDVSKKIKWITWNQKDLVTGYTYACEVGEFAKVVQHLPKLDVSNLLI